MTARRVDLKALPAGHALAEVLSPPHRAPPAAIVIEHDGHPVDAIAGEPLAVSLLAAGRGTLARSVKFHRPRGPSCMRAACDGCLTRVDGVPNVMACRVAARNGARIQSQNAFPSAALDVLRVTDWFFPKQFDHHHLMVQFGTTLNRTMQVFARRMAGLGTLPERDGPQPEAEAVACDVLIVGAGPSGLVAAATLARAGVSVLLVEEDDRAGGTLLDELGHVAGLDGRPTSGAALAATLLADALAAGADVRLGASAGATFDNATLVLTESHALVVRARARVFANGCTETIAAFESNDVPGVFTARAAARALRHGVAVGQRVVVVGSAWPAAGLSAALTAAGARVEWLQDARVLAAIGARHVTAARVTDARGGARTIKCDALIVADEATSAYELLGQAGVLTRPDAERLAFGPVAGGDGTTERADVFAAGSVRARMAPFPPPGVGARAEQAGAIADGRGVASAVLARLRRAAATSHEEILR